MSGAPENSPVNDIMSQNRCKSRKRRRNGRDTPVVAIRKGSQLAEDCLKEDQEKDVA